MSSTRGAERRRLRRDAALAAALPGPDATAAVDPVTGERLHPDAGHTPGDPPAWMTDRERLRTAPSPPAPAGSWARRARTSTAADPAGHPGRAAASGTARWWPSAAFAVLVPAAAVGICLGLMRGAPVLGHGWSPPWAGAALALAGATTVAIATLGPHARPRLRVVVTAVSALVVALFVTGLVSDPVIVDGVAYPSYSSTARQVRYAESIREELLTFPAVDALLTAKAADAWAAGNRYKPEIDHAEQSANSFQKQLVERDMPAVEFAAPVEHLAKAQYAAAKALQMRNDTLSSSEAKVSPDLDNARRIYIDETLACARALNAASSTLHLPVMVTVGSPG